MFVFLRKRAVPLLSALCFARDRPEEVGGFEFWPDGLGVVVDCGGEGGGGGGCETEMALREATSKVDGRSQQPVRTNVGTADSGIYRRATHPEQQHSNLGTQKVTQKM